MKDIILYLLLVLVVTVLVIGSVKYQTKPTPAPTVQKPTAYDVVRFCQELDANKTNSEWGYQSCYDDLMKTIGGEVRTL